MSSMLRGGKLVQNQ